MIYSFAFKIQVITTVSQADFLRCDYVIIDGGNCNVICNVLLLLAKYVSFVFKKLSGILLGTTFYLVTSRENCIRTNADSEAPD